MSTAEKNENSSWMKLAGSLTVRQQQAAFACTTGLPLVLLPASGNHPPSPANKLPAVFCVQGCMGPGSGASCGRVLLKAEARAAKTGRPVTFGCPAGLLKILAPVLAGNTHIGSLLAGPFSSPERPGNPAGRGGCGLDGDANHLRATRRQSPVITGERRRAVMTLVNLFADYLAECGNRLLLRQADSKSPLMQKIEAFLAEQRNGDLSLKAVAERVNLSPCHFCKVFKKQTGLTFSEYRTRDRIEHARRLLQAGRLRVSEAAFAAGFNSIPYFNRAFRRYVGCTPSEFRRKLGQ